jgi:hypothetical protein
MTMTDSRKIITSKEMTEAHKHYYSGSCGPGYSRMTPFETFSVGIFKALPKSNGKGFKKSAVIYRIKGRSDDPQAVFSRADKVCSMMDDGWVPSKKSETVGAKTF